MSFFNEAGLRAFGFHSPWDRLERMWLLLCERLDLLTPESYLRDVVTYTGLSADEIIERAQAKDAHKQAWYSRPRHSEADYRAFYLETDWYIFRQPWRYRLYTWHFLTTMLPPGGSMVEYGCGAACMTEWMSRRYPDYRYTVADIPSVSLDFARFRLKGRRNVKVGTIGMGKEGLPLTERYNLITCVEALEHTINPDEICEHFCEHLAEGGLLYLNFQNTGWGGENLEQARDRRPAALKILRSRLYALKAVDENGTDWGLYKR
jgi:2-polyprenyl-3-methyl-5-hydroxy-6-metoxy-1,4-benzoquinol methylase